MSDTPKPILYGIADRHGGRILEFVVRRHTLHARSWIIFARTSSYGGNYFVPFLRGFRTKRAAVAMATAINPHLST